MKNRFKKHRLYAKFHPRRKFKYSLDELLMQSDPNKPLSEEIKVWEGMQPIGREFGSAECEHVSAVDLLNPIYKTGDV